MVVIGVVVLSEGGEWGWASARSLGLIVVSMILAGSLDFSRAALSPSAGRSAPGPQSVGAHCRRIRLHICIAMYLFLPIVVEFIQVLPSKGFGFGASLLVSGLSLVPLSVGSSQPPASWSSTEWRFGPRTMIPLDHHVRYGGERLCIGSLSPVGGVRDHGRLWS